ncbi:hypothetical protein ACJBU6_03455 [Exserohilum turcicum]
MKSISCSAWCCLLDLAFWFCVHLLPWNLDSHHWRCLCSGYRAIPDPTHEASTCIGSGYPVVDSADIPGSLRFPSGCSTNMAISYVLIYRSIIEV